MCLPDQIFIFFMINFINILIIFFFIFNEAKHSHPSDFPKLLFTFLSPFLQVIMNDAEMQIFVNIQVI